MTCFLPHTYSSISRWHPSSNFFCILSHFFCSVLVSYSPTPSCNNCELIFTHAKTARLRRRCQETRLRLYIGVMYHCTGLLASSKFGQRQLAPKAAKYYKWMIKEVNWNFVSLCNLNQSKPEVALSNIPRLRIMLMFIALLIFSGRGTPVEEWL